MLQYLHYKYYIYSVTWSCSTIILIGMFNICYIQIRSQEQITDLMFLLTEMEPLNRLSKDERPVLAPGSSFTMWIHAGAGLEGVPTLEITTKVFLLLSITKSNTQNWFFSCFLYFLWTYNSERLIADMCSPLSYFTLRLTYLSWPSASGVTFDHSLVKIYIALINY